MTTGFIQRFKGKITTYVGGIYQGGAQSQAVFVSAGPPTSGGSGTLANIAGVGSLLVDTTNGVQYINTGTSSSPTWKSTGGNILGSVSVAENLTATGSTAVGALALTAHDNFMATVAAGTGVSLANLSQGQSQRVWDRTGTVALKVYVLNGQTIDGTAGSTGVSLTAPKAVEFFAQDGSTFVSTVLGTTSS
jgi:hypothetical protein